MNTQREIIYSQRRMVLENTDIRNYIIDMTKDVFDAGIESFIQRDFSSDNWDYVGLDNWLRAKFGPHAKIEHDEIRKQENASLAIEYMSNRILELYKEKEEKMGADAMRHLERMITLQVVDGRWKEHLYAMDDLRHSVGMRAYGQKDPLLEYKNEGYVMFQQLIDRIKHEIVEFLFRIQVAEDKRFRSVFKSLPIELVHQEFSGMSTQKKRASQQQPRAAQASSSLPDEVSKKPASSVRRDQPKVGRNDPCPCGSKKKYKKCCGR